ncbi:MAG: hypothetical protein R2854_06040 [Caldilineaceae bacterium]
MDDLIGLAVPIVRSQNAGQRETPTNGGIVDILSHDHPLKKDLHTGLIYVILIQIRLQSVAHGRQIDGEQNGVVKKSDVSSPMTWPT